MLRTESEGDREMVHGRGEIETMGWTSHAKKVIKLVHPSYKIDLLNQWLWCIGANGVIDGGSDGATGYGFSLIRGREGFIIFFYKYEVVLYDSVVIFYYTQPTRAPEIPRPFLL